MPAVRLLTAREAAAILGGNLTTLADWRSRGMPPKFILHGGVVRYSLSDIHAYIRNERRRTRQLAERMAFVIEQARRDEFAITPPSRPTT